MHIPDERPLTLRQADQARSDFYAIGDDLEFIKSQLATISEAKAKDRQERKACAR